jgi:hypothetical protein
MPPLSLRTFLASFLASCVTLASIHAIAAPSQDPEALIRQGVELRRRGEEVRAEGYFRRAYQLAATPRTAAQLGLVEMAVKEYRESETHLTEALNSRDAWVAEHRQTLEESRANVRKHLLRVEIGSAPKGTTFASEGAEASVLPNDAVIWLAPGVAASIRLEAAGHKSAIINIDGAAGQSRRVAVEMPALVDPPKALPPPTEPSAAVAHEQPQPPATLTQDATPPPNAARSPGYRLRVAGISVAAVGVAMGAVGGVLLVQGYSKRDSIMTAANSMGKINYNPSDGNWETFRAAGIACLVGGGVAVAGGVGLYILGRKAANEDGASVSFVPGSRFGYLSYRRTF